MASFKELKKTSDNAIDKYHNLLGIIYSIGNDKERDMVMNALEEYRKAEHDYQMCLLAK